MAFWWMTSDDRKIFEKAKKELWKDLRERPTDILQSGFTSYEHNPEKVPMISKIAYKYNGKEYQFKILGIKIKDLNEDKK